MYGMLREYLHRLKYSPLLAVSLVISGCNSAKESYNYSDSTATNLINEKRQELLKSDEPFTVSPIEDDLRNKLIQTQNLLVKDPQYANSRTLEKPEHWQYELDLITTSEHQLHEVNLDNLTLNESLMIAAAHSRDYQKIKEVIFRAAMSLDMQREDFRNSYAGLYDTLLTSNQNPGSNRTGIDNSFTASATRKLKSGASLTGKIAFDITRILSTGKASSTGVSFDSSVNIPLLSGSGEHIVTEDLTQAERNLIYAIWDFEKIKRSLVVTTATSFLSVIQLQDKMVNAETNYRSAISSALRARRLAEAGRLPDNQVSQAVQRELDGRARWINSEKSYLSRLDSFKLSLGLPTDSEINLKRDILAKLSTDFKKTLNPKDVQQDYIKSEDDIKLIKPTRKGGGPYELTEKEAIELALSKRLDLQTRHSRVVDAQRKIIIARDKLDPKLNLVGGYKTGGSRSGAGAYADDIGPNFSHGIYTAGLDADLPWDKNSEMHSFRQSYLNLESALRNYQELEDTIKLQIRERLRSLIQNRQSFINQQNAVALAERRVDSTNLFLQAGRVAIRDLLDAQDDLVEAQDSLTSSIVSYRLSELAIQRDMGTLMVNDNGLVKEMYE